jgi:hypothetical protein
MSIGFDSDEVILEKLRERLRRMTDEELIKFGKDVRKLVENPFQRQLDAAFMAKVTTSLWSEVVCPFLAWDREEVPFSHENGPCIVAMLTHALPSRRLKHDTPHDGVQRVGPVRMLFVVCPMQSKPGDRYHRTK